MTAIGLIIEGHGEIPALPVLVRRIAAWMDPALSVEPTRPHRVPRGKLVKKDEMQRTVELVARKAGPGAPILVLLDADDDCPARLGPSLLEWAREQRNDRDHGVVVAKSAYEAWFLAAAASLSGVKGLPDDLVPPPDPEGRRYPKAWLDERLPRGYSETVDQPALSAVFDLEQACAAPSFRKLVRDLARLLERPIPEPAREPEAA